MKKILVKRIQSEQGVYEVLISALYKNAITLQVCMDEDWDEEIEKFLHSFVDLKDAIMEDYADTYPRTLGVES